MKLGEHSVHVGPAPLDKLEAFASMTQLAVSLSNRLVAGPFSLVRRPADKRQPYIPLHRYGLAGIMQRETANRRE